ncbi:MAG: glycosyltransferase family 4 protein [Candidatus Methylomirabilales bacterium]
MDLRGDEKPLSVCMLISSFFPVTGGTERQCQELAASLLKAGVDVAVLTRKRKGLQAFELIEGIPVHRVPAPGKGMIASLSYQLFSLLWLRRHRGRYRILHAHQALSPALIAALARILFPETRTIVKITSTGETSDFRLGRAKLLFPIRRQLLRAIDTFVVLTESMRADLHQYGLGAAKIVKIPSMLDVSRFCPTSPKLKNRQRLDLGLPPEKKIVIHTGRDEPPKDLVTLLEAWALLPPRRREEAYLLIVGSSDPNRWETLAAQRGIQGTLSVRRMCGNIHEYLQTSDVLVLASTSEGLPNAVLEGLACGLPVVASDVGGVREVVQDQREGILVPPKDPAALASALDRVLVDSLLATDLGRQGRMLAETRFSLDIVTELYLALYRSLLNGGDL